MSTYTASYEVALFIEIEVDADTDKQAIKKALKHMDDIEKFHPLLEHFDYEDLRLSQIDDEDDNTIYYGV